MAGDQVLNRCHRSFLVLRLRLGRVIPGPGDSLRTLRETVVEQPRRARIGGFVMRRILVPLDGSPLAERILADACDLAGHSGELILLHVVRTPISARGVDGFHGKNVTAAAEEYLAARAKELRPLGLTVHTRVVMRADASAAIDEAAAQYNADLIACATHGRGPGGRLVHGGVAWRAIGQSKVPVLVRHITDSESTASDREARPFAIMVPLDGSRFAEKAIPLAERLSLKWGAAIWLARVVEPVSTVAAFGYAAVEVPEDPGAVNEAKRYLDDVAARLRQENGLEVHTYVAGGSTVDALTSLAREQEISHVVMSTHGRSALSRVLLGSVADDLVHKLNLPIILIPALAPGRLEDHEANPIKVVEKASAEVDVHPQGAPAWRLRY